MQEGFYINKATQEVYFVFGEEDSRFKYGKDVSNETKVHYANVNMMQLGTRPLYYLGQMIKDRAEDSLQEVSLGDSKAQIVAMVQQELKNVHTEAQRLNMLAKSIIDWEEEEIDDMEFSLEQLEFFQLISEDSDVLKNVDMSSVDQLQENMLEIIRDFDIKNGDKEQLRKDLEYQIVDFLPDGIEDFVLNMKTVEKILQWINEETL